MIDFRRSLTEILIRKSYFLDILVTILLSATLPLFFYKLGQSSLVNWDEAWYAVISRNILTTGDPLNLIYNGLPYIDHPPAGFWLIALSFKLFGINEFTARLASAVAGFISLIVVYFLGKELFNRAVGITSALALSSSVWFLYRARSGNLDTILAMFFVLTLLFAVHAVKSNIFLIPFLLSLTFLFLTKSLVPFTIILALIVVFWRSKNLNVNFWATILLFCLIIGSWFLTQDLKYGSFLKHYFKIGFPEVDITTSYLDNIKLVKEYLHSGIGKWFWPSVTAIFLGLFFRQKRFYFLAIFFVTFLFPFIFSSKGQIWHLIPLHPIIILALFGFLYTILAIFIKKEIVVAIIIFVIGVYYTFFQTQHNWAQFIDIPAYVSDEAILSKETAKYPYKFFVDGDFVPAAIFYSGKNVHQVRGDGLIEIFSDTAPFLLITQQWRIDSFNITPNQYSIIKSDRDKILVLRE